MALLKPELEIRPSIQNYDYHYDFISMIRFKRRDTDLLYENLCYFFLFDQFLFWLRTRKTTEAYFKHLSYL